ncbi:iron chelate uptake ABC transporter family permease subunit [Phycisphaerales bacterium AB-hyl4]|uniref:Iron chelate uptake ABC transporter family permease subunit n=1 Tax=Natronomicrosphaera hydrolytica TaxID=3242702 RepID=A0ABV4U4Y7_9BACT
MPELWDDLIRTLSLRDYNTRVVVLGVSMLGLAAGLVGTFMVLRKRALLSDAVSHATLPGIAGAFLLMVVFGGTGRSLPGLLIGAAVFGVLGMLSVQAIRRYTRLKDDVALGLVLSVYFGIGVAMLGLVQEMSEAHAAGISRFIYGKAATMVGSDALTMLIMAGVVAVTCAMLFKEFGLVCFDEQYAKAQGWPVGLIDVLMMSLIVAVTVIGLQAVGLILVVAMLIIPPAAARFWTDHLLRMTLTAGAIGMVSGYLGATLSGLVPRLPTGPIIVLVATAVFVVSLLAGTRRGVVVRAMRHVRSKRRTGLQHLLRAAFEHVESAGDEPFTAEALLPQRSWSPRELTTLLKRGQRQGWLAPTHDDRWRLTDAGLRQARQVVRNHRLWELYLIEHADIAPSHVDRDADRIEHVIGEAMVEQLERTLQTRAGAATVPASPH